MSVFAGTLTEDLSFYRIVETQTASGYHRSEEQYMFSCKACRLKNKQNYLVDANELFHTAELTFKLRNRRDVLDTDIVVYLGDRYRITSLDRFPRENDMTLILAKINE